MSEAREASRGRRGRGGRDARRAGQPTTSPSVPYITRKIPCFEVLDEEGLQLIENNADTILEEIGIEFRDMPEALEILKQAILLETRGKAFYQTAADQAQNKAVKDFFGTMAGEETIHIKMS